MNRGIEVSKGKMDLIRTKFDAYTSNELNRGFIDFLKQPEGYKRKFLQKKVNRVFDGYSYLGQSDSLNQYDTDLLHSFVLSDFSDKHIIPKEFHRFLNEEWQNLKRVVRELEMEVISKLNIEGLEQLYETSIGHMISCNYYPSLDRASINNGLNRLSSHKDISLFTVFLFGNRKGLSYKNEYDNMVKLGEIDKVVIFPGYLLEVLTEGKIRATDHQVEFDNSDDSERFSYAFFSIPKPNENLKLGNVCMSSEAYFKQYLSLF